MGLRPPKRNLLQLENPDGSKATMRIQAQVQKKVVPLVHPPRHRRKKKIPPIINAGQPEMFHITSKNMTTRSRLLWPKRKRSRLNTQQLQLKKPGLLVRNRTAGKEPRQTIGKGMDDDEDEDEDDKES